MKYFLIKKGRYGIPCRFYSNGKGYWTDSKAITILNLEFFMAKDSAFVEVSAKEYKQFLIDNNIKDNPNFNLRLPLAGTK